MIIYWNNALKSSSLRVLLPVPNPLESIPDHGNYSPITENLVSAAIYHVFSERELTFTFAICRHPSVCLSVVCRLSVTFVHPTQAIEIFGNVSTPFGTVAICDLLIKILRRSSQGNPSGEWLNQRGSAKYSDFGPFQGYISETVQDMS